VQISRREFGERSLFMAAADLLGLPAGPVFVVAPVGAQQIADRISATMGPAWNPASYRDTFKISKDWRSSIRPSPSKFANLKRPNTAAICSPAVERAP
jgi:hypothetical protein